MSSTDKALKLFNTGYNCSQSVFTTYAGRLNMDENTTKAIGAGFGGGIGKLKTNVCGAVAGAVMVIGVCFYDPNKNVESKNTCHHYSAEIVKTIEEKYGSCRCQDILNQGDGTYGICEKVIVDICLLVDNMII